MQEEWLMVRDRGWQGGAQERDALVKEDARIKVLISRVMKEKMRR